MTVSKREDFFKAENGLKLNVGSLSNVGVCPIEGSLSNVGA